MEKELEYAAGKDGEDYPFEIVKQKPEQFPIDEIMDEDARRVKAWLSVEIKDLQGEVIPVSELRKTLNEWMLRGGIIMDSHSNRPIGKALRWFEQQHGETKKRGIVIEYQLHKGYTVEDDAWEEIKNGIRRGLSFGGRATGKSEKKNATTVEGKQEPAKFLSGIEAYEVSSVRNPANPLAENMAINYLAKSNSTNTIKEVAVIDIQKPFAGFEDFAACVDAQKSKGHDEESSKKICGYLQAKTEKAEEVAKPNDTERPPKAWWDRCVSSVGGKADNPEALCGWVFYHHLDTGKSVDPCPEMTAEQAYEVSKDAMTESARRRKRNWLRAKKMPDEWTEKDMHDAVDDFFAQIHAVEPTIDLKGGSTKVVIGNNMEGNKEETKTTEEVKTEPSVNKEELQIQLLKDISAKLDSLIQTKKAEEKKPEDKKPEDEDEDKKPEEKSAAIDALVDKKVDEKLKSMGVTKVSTPRPETDFVKKHAEKNKDFALELLEKAKKGMTQAELNKSVKTHVVKAYEDNMRDVLEALKKESE